MIIRATDDPLVGFVYLLLRDHVLPGEAEKLLATLREQTHGFNAAPSGGYQLSNPFLADYARDFVERIRELRPIGDEKK